MDLPADKALSVNELWPKLGNSSRVTVCKAVFAYRGSDVSEYFQSKARASHSAQLKSEAETQSAATGKRKLDDSDTADAPSALKKPKVAEASAPLQTKTIDLASPKFPLGWPTFRQSPVKFGQPTLTAATGDTTPTTWSSGLAASSGPSGNTQDSSTGFSTVSTPGLSSSSPTVSTPGALASSSTGPTRGGLFTSSAGSNMRLFSSSTTASARGVSNRGGLFSSSSTVFGRGGNSSTSSTVPKQGPCLGSFGPGFFGNAKAKTPTQQEPDCDEQFTFFDRQSSQAPAPPTQQSQSTQYRFSEQIPSSSSSDNPSQGTNGSLPVSAVYKPPLAGVDMSSLKIPANSNVNVTLNVFQAPSSLHQVTDGGASRKLKCIQCKAFYMEAQNTALQCRRHTGRCVGANDPKLSYQDLPAGAHQIWDCCRRTMQSRGCYPCNHYAG